MSGKARRSLETNKISCEQCRMDIKENEDSIECDKCGKSLHVLCTSLDKRQFTHLLNNESEDFFCNFCNESGEQREYMKKELTEIKQQLNN